MKLISFSIIAIVLSLTCQAAQPTAQLQFANVPDGWTPHTVTPGTFEAVFSSNADAVFNLHEDEADGPLATVRVHHLHPPAHMRLTDDTLEWHKFLLSQSKAKPKVDPNHERTYLVNGKWRYIVEYRAGVGGHLYTIAMFTIVDGELYVMTFDHQQAMFAKLVSPVNELFKTVTLTH